MAESGTAKWVISFGPFRLSKARRLLERDGDPVHLGSRAFDILSHLLEHAGQVVSHRELMAAAWPASYVEEGNLRFQLTNLRKALAHDGKAYIVNVPGRGYCFTAQTIRTTEEGEGKAPRRPNNPVKGTTPLPKSKHLVGRSSVTAKISDLVRSQRLVTIVGPGGMGKTSVAIAAAEQSTASFPGGVCFFELGLVQDPLRVTDALAVALGLPTQGADSLIDIVALLEARQMLIVVDCCEHVINTITSLLEAIIAKTSDVHFLATSREALRTEYEQVLHLEPLEAPPTSGILSDEEIQIYPASKLFIERIGRTLDGESPHMRSQLIAQICGKLDGLPLAIELAASQAQMFGLGALTDLLEGPFALAWPGRRDAPEKHRTISAMLDWSYRLLTEEERRAFRLISIFGGPFDLETVRGLAEKDGHDVAAALPTLAAKSLLAVRHTKSGTRYSLLDLTKAYARSKLSEGELDTLNRRHANHYERTMKTLLSDGRDPVALSILGEQIDDIRKAMVWAFSSQGDSKLAIALATAAIPVWSHLHLYQEWHDYLAEALMVANQIGVDGTTELNLHFGFANALAYTNWISQDYKNAWAKVHSLAEREKRVDHQLYALFLLHVAEVASSHMGEAREYADRLDEIVKSTGSDAWSVIADFALGSVKQLTGHLEEGHDHLQRIRGDEKKYSRPAEPAMLRPGSRLLFDSRLTQLLASLLLANNLLLRGNALEAVEIADRALGLAESEKHLAAKVILLEWTTINWVLLGYYDRAKETANASFKFWQEIPLMYYNAVAPAHVALANAWCGDREGLRQLNELIPALSDRARNKVRYFMTQRQHLLIHLKERGEYEPALEPLSTDDSNAESWCIPEMIRLNGRLAMLNGQLETAQAEFSKSLHVARDQGSTLWELRAAIDLASLLITQNKADEAQKLLGSTLPKISPDVETEDLKRARALMAQFH